MSDTETHSIRSVGASETLRVTQHLSLGSHDFRISYKPLSA